MTEWERSGDLKWKNKILVGVNDFAKMPYGLFSAKGKDAGMGYDPKTNHMYQLDPKDIGALTLATMMGGMEMAWELTPILNNKDWSRLYLQYTSLYGAPVEEMQAAFGPAIKNSQGQLQGDFAREPAYAYYVTKDPKYAQRAWDAFLPNQQPGFGRGGNAQGAAATPGASGARGAGRNGGGGAGRVPGAGRFDSQVLSGPMVIKPLNEIRNVSTNSTSQWCLNAIELLQLAGDKIPEHNVAWDK
jgi:hypothetical protein